MGKKTEQLRRTVAAIIEADAETWPEHGNVHLAIAATLALYVAKHNEATRREEEKVSAAASEMELEIQHHKDRYAAVCRALEEQVAQVHKRNAEIAQLKGELIEWKCRVDSMQTLVEKMEDENRLLKHKFEKSQLDLDTTLAQKKQMGERLDRLDKFSGANAPEERNV